MDYNNRQQPPQRNYRRDRSRAEQDEWNDYANGGDYTFSRPMYRDDEVYERNNFGEPSFSGEMYSPAFDYGRNDFDGRRPPGYGAEGSAQNRDFENWRREEGRFRNRNFQVGMERASENSRFGEDLRYRNRGFEEGLYDYRDQHFRHDNRMLDRDEFESSRHRTDMEHWDRYHNRSDRHIEIVRPFKMPEDYGWNDLEHSVGFGNREMVFHRDRRPDEMGED